MHVWESTASMTDNWSLFTLMKIAATNEVLPEMFTSRQIGLSWVILMYLLYIYRYRKCHLLLSFYMLMRMITWRIEKLINNMKTCVFGVFTKYLNVFVDSFSAAQTKLVGNNAYGYTLTFVKVIQNGVKPFINEIVKKSCFHVDL